MFHDTNIYEGVIRFFGELDLPKYNFTHSFGLGDVSKNKELISKIKEIWYIPQEFKLRTIKEAQ